MLHRAREARDTRRLLTRVLALLLCAALLGGAAVAQRKARRNRGPRALALVQWAGAGAPRVIPIAIMVDGQFYDASIYKASPVPMALEPGTVYEVEESGASVGLITLTDARETRQGAWFADGRYQTHAQLAAARAPRKETPAPTEPEGPPKLRRGPAPSPSGSASAPPAAAPHQPGPDEPPVLHKPAEPAPAAQTPAPTGQAAGTAAAPAPAKPEAHADESGRPVLRRGRPSAEQAETIPEPASPAASKPGKPAAGAAAAPGKASTAAGRVLAAISDAGGPEPRSYAFPWTPQEQQHLSSSVEALATGALQQYARAHPGATPGKLENVQVRAFDLDYNNSPDLVLTASASQAPPAVAARRGVTRTARAEPPVPSLTFWVTVVVREDLNGDLRKLMFSVTDNRHLDAFPRMELIDAVDADGDGRGELLFREISDVGRNYVIYRVTPDTLTALFNSAELEE